uniref:Uncharacterized protein n=1 Tax=Rhizophora mucronata TaxID=61149 RepID=A0A2P2PWU5_RHIMU
MKSNYREKKKEKRKRKKATKIDIRILKAQKTRNCGQVQCRHL